MSLREIVDAVRAKQEHDWSNWSMAITFVVSRCGFAPKGSRLHPDDFNPYRRRGQREGFVRLEVNDTSRALLDSLSVEEKPKERPEDTSQT